MIKKILIALVALFALPAIAFAVQISVPSAPGANYVLLSTATGVYTPVATSTLGIIGGSGVWPFTTGLTNYGVAVQATTTPEWFQSGVFASSTSRFVNASTTALTVSGGSFLNTLLATASSTIGDGTQVGGLTINGGGTSTKGFVVGNTAENKPLTVIGSTIGSTRYLTPVTGFASTDGFEFSTDSSNAYMWNYENGHLYFGTNNDTVGEVIPGGTWVFNYATTSAITATTLCFTGDTCRTTWPSGGAWPWTVATNYATSTNSTTTPSWFKMGLFASSTSQLAYATTTALGVTGTAYFPGAGIWDSSGNVGIGTTSPDTPLQIGENVPQTPDATIMMSRNITGAGNGHGISDETNFNTTGAYNSFDARAQLYGIGTSAGSHYAAFQARPDFYHTTTLPVYRAYAASSPTINGGGTITDYYGYIFSGPTIVSGSVTNAYGSYISNIGPGATNKWAFYAVADKSYFGGNVGIGTTTPLAPLQIANTTGDQLVLSDTNATAGETNYFLESSGGDFNIGTTSDDGATTANILTIEQNGEVGIGTISPASKLQISGNTTEAQRGFSINTTHTSNSVLPASSYFDVSPTITYNFTGSPAIQKLASTINTGVDITTVFNSLTSLSLNTVPNIISNIFLNSSSLTRAAGYTGTTTTLVGYRYLEGTNAGTGVITNQVGLNIQPLDDATNNTSILLGNANAQAGNFGILSMTDYPNLFQASTTDTTTAPLVIGSNRAAIVSGNSLGNLQFWSNDTNYTAPGKSVAEIGALANQTHTVAQSGTDLVFRTMNTLTMGERVRITGAGKVGVGTTSPWGLLSIKGADTSASTLSFVVSDSADTVLAKLNNAGLFTLLNASSTNLSASQSLFVGSNRVSGERYISFKLATSTAWTGTSTYSIYADTFKIGNIPFTGSISRISCGTDAGTITVAGTNGTNTTYIVASTTANYNTYSLSFTSGNAVTFTAGNPATSPTLVNCTAVATGY